MTPANTNQPEDQIKTALSDLQEFVTVVVDDQIFGLPIDRVHDVYIATSLTAVPLSPMQIKGLLNLRGRVVTAMCLRRRLGISDATHLEQNMAVGLEHHGESFGLLVDSVGEVMKLGPDKLEPNPVHLDPNWVKLSKGVHRLDEKLLIILDVDAVLNFDIEESKAA
jgi:purine-binding chemotaxis protein CheW